MGHIHENVGEHDQTVSAFIVREDADTPKVLLHMHKKLQVLLQPGGHVELGENPWQAISHEIAEETGFEIDQLQILQPYDRIKTMTRAINHPIPVAYNTHNFTVEGTHKHTDASYAFVTQGEPTLAVAEGESTDIRWFSLEDLNNLDSSLIFENVREIGRFVLTTIIDKWERVDTAEYNQ